MGTRRRDRGGQGRRRDDQQRTALGRNLGRAGAPDQREGETVRSQTEAPAGASITAAKLLSELDLMRLRQLLLYEIERGMSCAGLWQHILELRRLERPGKGQVVHRGSLLHMAHNYALLSVVRLGVSDSNQPICVEAERGLPGRLCIVMLLMHSPRTGNSLHYRALSWQGADPNIVWVCPLAFGSLGRGIENGPAPG